MFFADLEKCSPAKAERSNIMARKAAVFPGESDAVRRFGAGLGTTLKCTEGGVKSPQTESPSRWGLIPVIILIGDFLLEQRSGIALSSSGLL